MSGSAQAVEVGVGNGVASNCVASGAWRGNKERVGDKKGKLGRVAAHITKNKNEKGPGYQGRTSPREENKWDNGKRRTRN